MRNQQLFEAPFVSEVGAEYCSKCTKAEVDKCRCKQCQRAIPLHLNSSFYPNLGNEAEWLFEVPFISPPPMHYKLPRLNLALEWEEKDPNRASNTNVHRQIANAKLTIERLKKKEKQARIDANDSKKDRIARDQASFRLHAILKAIAKVERILKSLQNTKIAKIQQHSYMTPERINRLAKEAKNPPKGSQPPASILAPKYANPKNWSFIGLQALKKISNGDFKSLKNGGKQVYLGPFSDFTGWLNDSSLMPDQAKKVYRLLVVFDAQNKWHHYPVP